MKQTLRPGAPQHLNGRQSNGCSRSGRADLIVDHAQLAALAASLNTVFRKLCPRGPYTQLVRRVR
jgi:hypothetical protein